MADPYDGPTAPEPRTGSAGRPAHGPVRPVLWLLLVLCAVCNAVTSAMDGAAVAVSLGFGLATLACGVGLYVHHRRARSVPAGVPGTPGQAFREEGSR